MSLATPSKFQESKLHPEETDKKDISLSKRIRSMIKKIDAQLDLYDAKVGGSLKMIEVDSQGRISLADLEKALQVIKHKPDEESVHKLMDKLDRLVFHELDCPHSRGEDCWID